MRMDVPSNAPEHCPGTQSESAGKVSACQGCPNQSVCASGQAQHPDPDIEIIKKTLASIKHKILILSGKGGVGKSALTGMLAFGLAADPQRNYVDENLAVISVGFLLGSPDDAVIWRGPKKNGMIKQFLRDVDWGDTEYLLIDTPPGTSDEHLSIVQYLLPAGLDGAIIITTPQEVALLDVRKEINFCHKVNLPILGVVENMSTFVCPKCHKGSEIFPAFTGGAEKMTQEMGIPFLGRIPLDPIIGKMCDEGRSFLIQHPDSLASKAALSIIEKIQNACNPGKVMGESG
ncbi:unnamed protein product [Darwinula stevensoni]|uniref:Cytosolic Fe-S cluster assembly factor NUBP1 homolog n=1 Tax=Darwinula stevensoni TaxID=69355 RepID=A0A7R9A6A3_9CRUS|nr:unnamed protein product [Darwinula stevensoni]CAG0893876.1 unnamed protein product [Darwinula stevensoni]